MTIEIVECATIQDEQRALEAFLDRTMETLRAGQILPLEILDCRDWDPWRGYSLWLAVRFPTRIGKSHWIPAWACRQMTNAARAAFVKRYGYKPPLIQNVQRSAWWRVGPVEEVAE